MVTECFLLIFTIILVWLCMHVYKAHTHTYTHTHTHAHTHTHTHTHTQTHTHTHTHTYTGSSVFEDAHSEPPQSALLLSLKGMSTKCLAPPTTSRRRRRVQKGGWRWEGVGQGWCRGRRCPSRDTATPLPQLPGGCTHHPALSE